MSLLSPEQLAGIERDAARGHLVRDLAYGFEGPAAGLIAGYLIYAAIYLLGAACALVGAALVVTARSPET